jgi:hypothetical protein
MGKFFPVGLNEMSNSLFSNVVFSCISSMTTDPQLPEGLPVGFGEMAAALIVDVIHSFPK